MIAIQVKTKETKVDNNSTAITLQTSFAAEITLEDEELMGIVAKWIDVED